MVKLGHGNGPFSMSSLALRGQGRRCLAVSSKTRESYRAGSGCWPDRFIPSWRLSLQETPDFPLLVLTAKSTLTDTFAVSVPDSHARLIGVDLAAARGILGSSKTWLGTGPRETSFANRNPLLRYERAAAIDRVQARINEQIRISPVRVISSNGTQLGVMPTLDAVRMAREEGYDLVEVAPLARPPVCRIMDYGKYKYEKGKKSAKGKSHQTKTKEIRVRPKTGQHDIDFKVKQAIGFLQHKDKVQVTVMFRGRELAHVEEGRKVMDQILEQLAEFGKIESQPSTQQKRMMCTVAPK